MEKIVTHFLKGGATSDQLGVITPYEGQRAHVLQVMLRNGTMRQQLYTDIEVASVDSFQGREKDYTSSPACALMSTRYTLTYDASPCCGVVVPCFV